jgi:hypothetical protein
MKQKLITGLVIGLLVFAVQMSFVVDSFPGFHSNGDCTVCHNNPAMAWNASLANSQVTVDGITDDAMWLEANTLGRRNMVPVASKFGSAHEFITMYFGQNSTHFFMVASWHDATINGYVEDSDFDGFSIIFNINNTDFDTGYGMDLARDGMVDFISWTPDAGQTAVLDSNSPQSIDSTIVDLSSSPGSNARTVDATNEWTVGAVHGNVSLHSEENYQVEFARPLVTADKTYDVQFSESKYYEFGIVIFNETSGSSHWISPPQSVFVYNAADTNADLATVTDYIVETKTETAAPVTETVTADPVTETVTDSEGKSPISILPVVLALFAVPMIVLIRRRT